MLRWFRSSWQVCMTIYVTHLWCICRVHKPWTKVPPKAKHLYAFIASLAFKAKTKETQLSLSVLLRFYAHLSKLEDVDKQATNHPKPTGHWEFWTPSWSTGGGVARFAPPNGSCFQALKRPDAPIVFCDGKQVEISVSWLLINGEGDLVLRLFWCFFFRFWPY